MSPVVALWRSKEEVRRYVWRVLKERGVAAPPFPIEGRIPNFKGAKEAAERLASTPEWMRAGTVKVNPDSPQRWVRMKALEEGKVLLMPTPRIRQGFLLLDPSKIPKDQYAKASTIRGAFKYGTRLNTIDKLLKLTKLDLIVEGSVAVDTEGRRVGKGEGYGDIEYGILSELGLVDDTPIFTTVHDLQVLPPPLPQDPWDVPLNASFTPSKEIRFRGLKRPKGIIWELLNPKKLEEIPLLRELKARTFNT